MRKNFLVAVDGSEHGWKALDLATDLANSAEAGLMILHVVSYEPMPEGLKQFAEVEGIPPEEIGARYHLSKEIGDKITSEAEARVRMNGLSTLR